MAFLRCKAFWQSLTGISLFYGVAKVVKKPTNYQTTCALIHELLMHIKQIPALNDLMYLLTVELHMYESSLS
jgi:hypothetical protein